MSNPFLRKLLIGATAAFAVAAFDAGTAFVRAEAPAAGAAIVPQSIHKIIKLGLNKSLVIDLPRDARDVLVSNPGIADAVIRTPRRIYLTGVAIGQANII